MNRSRFKPLIVFVLLGLLLQAAGLYTAHVHEVNGMVSYHLHTTIPTTDGKQHVAHGHDHGHDHEHDHDHSHDERNHHHEQGDIFCGFEVESIPPSWRTASPLVVVLFLAAGFSQGDRLQAFPLFVQKRIKPPDSIPLFLANRTLLI